MRLILASASPRRRDLLARLGLPFEVRPSGVEETLDPGVPAPSLAMALARAKARDTADGLSVTGEGPALVLGADTLVVLDGRPVGKPATREEAGEMLRALRGRRHEVVTAVVLLHVPGGRELAETVTSQVFMRPYGDHEIDTYVATGEPDDKAGAYAVQGAGRRLVTRVEGCYTNVVGLPLQTTARMLRTFGLAPRDPSGPPEASLG
ncbi:MAG TPA: Maf family protein [Methylomirabilota bacterium]|nr:Maf family protein [Methylomirabilota bacterium]